MTAPVALVSATLFISDMVISNCLLNLHFLDDSLGRGSLHMLIAHLGNRWQVPVQAFSSLSYWIMSSPFPHRFVRA